jgi:hypothetical protein
MQRLGHREGEGAAKARVQVEDPAQDRHRAHRLGRDADRQAAGLGEHAVGVAPQRVEVDERERRCDGREDRVVTSL